MTTIVPDFDEASAAAGTLLEIAAELLSPRGLWTAALAALCFAALIAALVLLVCKKRRAGLICLAAAVVFAAAGTAVFCLLRPARAEEPQLRAGELNAQDFAAGYTLRVTEGYTTGGYSAFTHSQPQSWTVTNAALREEIYQLCTEISCYREMNLQTTDPIYYDGFPVEEHYPSLCFDCGEVRYRIQILNWDSVVPQSAIAQEKSGEPLVWLRRMDDLEYISSQGFPPDTLNGEGGCGWYSLMPRASLERLLELLESVGEKNAEPLAGSSYPAAFSAAEEEYWAVRDKWMITAEGTQVCRAPVDSVGAARVLSGWTVEVCAVVRAGEGKLWALVRFDTLEGDGDDIGWIPYDSLIEYAEGNRSRLRYPVTLAEGATDAYTGESVPTDCVYAVDYSHGKALVTNARGESYFVEKAYVTLPEG